MSQLRIAVIGAGHLGRIHAKLISQVDGAKLAAVCDPHEAAREQAAALYEVPTYADYRDCLDDCDAAIVAAATDVHAPIVKDLLKAGKHVFVEKPLTIDRDDAKRLSMLASARRVTLQVGHVERFNPAFTALENLAVDAKFVEAVRASSFPGRCLDVGVVMDLMIHDIDLVLSMSDAAVRSVSASGLAMISDHEDLAEARIELECGLVANLKASRVSPTPRGACRFSAARDLQISTLEHPRYRWCVPVSRSCPALSASTKKLTSRLTTSAKLFSERLRCETIELEPRNAILDELHDFVISIQTGIAPTVDGAAGSRAVDVAQQVLEAIDQRVWYADASPTEVGPYALVRERIEDSSRRIRRDRAA